MKYLIFFVFFISCSVNKTDSSLSVNEFIQLALDFVPEESSCNNGPTLSTKEFEQVYLYYIKNANRIAYLEKKKGLLLVFIKIYKWHLICFNQSFDLKSTIPNELLNEYFKIVRKDEFLIQIKESRQVLSSEVFSDVLKISNLREWPPLKQEVIKIQRLLKYKKIE